jgi:hypothetical protein
MALTSLNASTNALANYTSLTSNTTGSGVKDNSSKTQEAQTNTSGAKPANSSPTTKVKEAQSPAVTKSISAEAWNYSSTPSTTSSPSTYAPAYDTSTGQPPGREGESQSAASAPPPSPPPTPNASTNALAAYTSLMATVFEGAKNAAAAVARTGESASVPSEDGAYAGAKASPPQQSNGSTEQLGAGWSRNADGTLKYESNIASQLVVPGRIPLDGMFTDAANGNYLGAAINLATAAIEDAVFVLTLGASQAKTAGARLAQLGAKKVAQASAPVVAKEVAKSVDPRLIGKFDPPVGIKFGTTTFGQYAHREAAAIVKQDLATKGVAKVVDRTEPGMRGVDLSVPKEFAPRLGFEHVEIKPDTVSGLSSYNRSVVGWGYDPSTVRSVTYDASGRVFWGFTK